VRIAESPCRDVRTAGPLPDPAYSSVILKLSAHRPWLASEFLKRTELQPFVGDLVIPPFDGVSIT
jgi:hypothetical protein